MTGTSSKLWKGGGDDSDHSSVVATGPQYLEPVRFWSAKTTPALATTTPVTPPSVNKKINPTAHSSGVLNSIEPPHIVAIHEKILTSVGTATTIVAGVKYARVSTVMPVVNM